MHNIILLILYNTRDGNEVTSSWQNNIYKRDKIDDEIKNLHEISADVTLMTFSVDVPIIILRKKKTITQSTHFNTKNHERKYKRCRQKENKKKKALNKF